MLTTTMHNPLMLQEDLATVQAARTGTLEMTAGLACRKLRQTLRPAGRDRIAIRYSRNSVSYLPKMTSTKSPPRYQSNYVKWDSCGRRHRRQYRSIVLPAATKG